MADRQTVYRVRASDGHVEWSRSLPAPVWIGPVVAGSQAGVLLEGGRELVALDCRSGAIRWRKTEQDRDWDRVWKASLLVGHNEHFILDAADPGRVVSIDGATGQIAWIFESPRAFPVPYPSAIVPAGKLLLTNLGALEASTGRLAASVVDDVQAISYRGTLAVLATNQGAIVGVDLRAPDRQRWTVQASGWNLGSITVGDRAVVVTTHSHDRWRTGQLLVLNPESGRELWSKTAEIQDGAPYDLATLDTKHVYLVGASQTGTAGSVTAFDLRTGRVAWTQEPGGAVLPPAVVVDDTLFVSYHGSSGKRLLRLNAGDGSVVWIGPAESGRGSASTSVR
jgi:outer membrane protein assembly factor BamB